MARALVAGAAYFAAVFAIGFILGVLRVLVVAPRVGETAAVALEIPIVLVVSWLLCGRIAARLAVPPADAPRLVMGAVALALLMGGELVISLFLAGRSLAEHVALYRTLPHLVGLAGQVAFALLPLVQARRRKPHF